jgi:hypothetical protein
VAAPAGDGAAPGFHGAGHRVVPVRLGAAGVPVPHGRSRAARGCHAPSAWH